MSAANGDVKAKGPMTEEESKYYARCVKYILDHETRNNPELLPSEHRWPRTDWPELPTPELYKEVVAAAHALHNAILLSEVTMLGCHDFRKDDYCSDNDECENCVWHPGDNRCTCGNYKGFIMNFDGVDWQKDITLDSKDYVGRQDTY